MDGASDTGSRAPDRAGPPPLHGPAVSAYHDDARTADRLNRRLFIAWEIAPLMPPVPDLSRLIPLSARVVLDVGCGRGELGAAYRRLNPNARLLAIDNDPAMVEAARPHYDECVVADAQAETLPFDTRRMASTASSTARCWSI